jgi:N-methylhydantoinase A
LAVEAGEGWTDRFHTAHAMRYGYDRRDAVVEAVTLRVEALAPGARIAAPELPPADTPEPTARVLGRLAAGIAATDASHYNRDQLRAGHVFEGPAIVMEYTSTFWLPAGWRVTVLQDGSLLATRGSGAHPSG